MHEILAEHGDRVRFFSCGTTRNPYPYWPIFAAVFEQFWDHFLPQDFESLLVPEEVSDPYEQVFKQVARFARLLLHITNVVREFGDAVYRHPSFNTAKHGVLLVMGEIVSRLRPDDYEYLLQMIGFLGGYLSGFTRYFEDGVSGVRNELLRQLFDRQDIVGQSCRYRISGHPVMLSRLRVLHHPHTALALDRPQTKGPFGPGSRKYNADGIFFLILR